jgi:hypothetical protein
VFHLNVPNLDEHCRPTIMSTLMGVDGRAECQLDMDQKRVSLTSTMPPSDFIEALEEVGYTSFIAQV